MNILKLILYLLITATVTYAQVIHREADSITYNSTNWAYSPIPTGSRLIKTGIGLPLFRASSVSATWMTIGMDAMIEQKVGKNLSILGGIETNYGFSRNNQLYTIDLPIGFRYYFSLGRKMKSQADPHSLFRYYVGFRTESALYSNLHYKFNIGTITYYRGQFLDRTVSISRYEEAFNFMQYAYFQLGSQFRLKTGKYLDVNAAIPISSLINYKQEYTLATPAYVTLKYGLYWSK